MIKTSLEELLHKLNNLDPNSDTVIKFDCKNKICIVTQKENSKYQIPELFLLVNNSNKVFYSVILKRDLSYLKDLLFYILNHYPNCSIYPKNKGFEVYEWTEILNKKGITRTWIKYDGMNLCTNSLKLWLLSRVSVIFKTLLRSLRNVNFS